MLEQFTVKQLMIASGLSRNVKKTHICRYTGVTGAYISKLEKDAAFLSVVRSMTGLPTDNDHKVFQGKATLLADTGRLLYQYAERQLKENKEDEENG